MIKVHGKQYELLENVRNGFQEDTFHDRFSEILMKYDYIVGDWGYNQLRLKGFYKDQNPKATFDSKISFLDDYIYEFCNFGCAYFVLHKVHK